MLSLVAPWWLLGLLLLPVIRWLHRGGQHRRTVPVSRLGLWRGAVVNQPAQGGRRPPDPAWRRRALLTALLCLALAEPQRPSHQPGLTLWVDDSISMQAREGQGTRLALALAQARSLIAQETLGDVEVRSLVDPWQNLGALSEAVATTLEARAGRKEPAAPPAALLRPDRLHWLVTDGADAALLEWPEGRRADRVIQVAGTTRNVGIERLSARLNPAEPDKVELLLKLTNGGTAVESRVVVFTAGAEEVARSSQRLEPGASVLVAASMPASAQVRARLQPADALAEDDQIALDLAALRRRRVAVDPACPPALVAAVGSHPALLVAPLSAQDVEVLLDCGTPHAARGVPTIGLRADRMPTRAAAPVQWSQRVAQGSRVPLDATRLHLSARLQMRPGDQALLVLGDEPVIVRRAGAVTAVETSLDLASVGLASGPELPLLVNLLFERALDGRLLDAVAVNDRGPAASRVVPINNVVAQTAARPMGRSGTLDSWVRPLVWLAGLLLLWEASALTRQWTRLRPGAGRVAE